MNNFEVNSGVLIGALNDVLKAVPSKPNMPILSCVKFELDTMDVMSLSATNLEMSIKTFFGVRLTNGTDPFLLDAKTLLEVVKTFGKDSRLEFSVHPDKVIITDGKSKSTFKTMNVDAYPVLPNFEQDNFIELSGHVFKRALDATAFTAAKDDNRPVLTGILMQAKNGILNFAAADGYRLALYEVPQQAGDFEAIVPSKHLASLAKLLTDDGFIRLSLNQDRLVANSQGLSVSINLIEGRFPDYAAIIPKTSSTRAHMMTADLLQAAKQAMTFAKDSADAVFVVVDTTMNEVRVGGTSQERGDAISVIDKSLMLEGDYLEISLNGVYLIEVLEACGGNVMLKFGNSGSPVLMTTQDNCFTHVIMPMSKGS